MRSDLLYWHVHELDAASVDTRIINPIVNSLALFLGEVGECLHALLVTYITNCSPHLYSDTPHVIVLSRIA